MARKTHTSTEVKTRWKKKTYVEYSVAFRKDDDKPLIEFVDTKKKNGMGTTEVFREAVEALIEKENE